MAEELIPIDIPLDKGLFSYRVAFIRANDQGRLAQVRDNAGLRRLRIGAVGEATAAIFRHNGIETQESQDAAADAGTWTLRPVPARGNGACRRV